MSHISRCYSNGKSIATASGSMDSESSGSPLVRRPRAIILRGMEGPRFPTGADLAELNDQEHSVVHFSIELENREVSGHASSDEMELKADDRLSQVTKSVDEADLAYKEEDPFEMEPDFRLADFLPMRWTGINFVFVEEIDPEKERRFSVKKNQKWENHLPTQSSFKSVRRLAFQTDHLLGSRFLYPTSTKDHGRLLSAYACVYESWFNNCRLWWPLPELLTTYCSRRKIALGQYTANGIRIMLDITMSVRLFVELITPSITTKTGFFYRKTIPKYNVLTGKPSKVNHWNQPYFYVKINEASFEDSSVILKGYFNANIVHLGKWAQGCSDTFWEQVEAIRTLSHQHWPNISETRIQAALNIIVRESKKRRKKMGKFNLASLPSYAASIGTPPASQEGSSSLKKITKRTKTSHSEGASNVSHKPSPSPKSPARQHLVDDMDGQAVSPRLNEEPDVRSFPLEPIDQTEMVMVTGEAQVEHLEDPTLEGVFPDENRGSSPSASQDDEVVEYPHLVDFHYHHIKVPFVGDQKALARLFRQIKLKSKGMPELDELSQRGRYWEMARAGANFFGYANLMVRDYGATIKAQKEKLAEKNKSLRKKKENAELKGKWDMYEEKVGQIMTEKDQAMEMDEMEKSRGNLLSKELEEIKAQKEMLESRLRELEQEKVQADSKFEMTTKRLRDSREHAVMHVYEKMRQYLDEQPAIQIKLILYSQVKGDREGLEKIQALGMSIDELNAMEVIDSSEINLQPLGLDEHGFNLTIFLPQDIEDLRHSD
ncbi:hypothetical protein N665_0107s0011 [Sinapis alba]|nr:hypothetical protein N665_0107s0011 [Sinapis alba]